MANKETSPFVNLVEVNAAGVDENDNLCQILAFEKTLGGCRFFGKILGKIAVPDLKEEASPSSTTEKST